MMTKIRMFRKINFEALNLLHKANLNENSHLNKKKLEIFFKN